MEDTQKKTNVNAKWYILNCINGHEDRVAELISQMVDATETEGEVLQVVVPKQEKTVIKDGKKKTVVEKIFPGYVLVHMVMNDTNWYRVRNIDGVMKFIGLSRKPNPLTDEEVESILAFQEVKQDETVTTNLSINDVVKVTDGNFKDFVG